jgi:D-3-phosphoglycerate dehydrogenase
MKYSVLISDKFDPEGIRLLESESEFQVISSAKGYNREEFLRLLPEASGLIIRSATRVDAEALSVAKNLRLIIRAGVGVDNIDIPEASRRGIIVMNSPGGNSISTAELAISLMMSLARNIPQSNASMKGGKWEKSRFVGTELTGKTLGVVGLGRIGREVVRRARSLKMEVIGFDPYIPEEALKNLEIEIVNKEEILKRSDFLTVHTPLTDTTKDFVSLANLSTVKKGIRLINCARGGIYNEEALAEGLKSGQIGGVALDVFTEEPPPTDFPLRGLENCIMTPHLGASTEDAEFAVAMDTVRQMIDYFTKGVANFALNYPALDPAEMLFLQPFITGGEQSGKILGSICEGEVNALEIRFDGNVSSYRTEAVLAGIMRGLLSISMGDEVNLVNAPYLARDRGIHILKSENPRAIGYESTVSIKCTKPDGTNIELSYTCMQSEPLIVSMQGLPIEFKPEGILILIENRDVPRVVGMIGMFLGDHAINIARLELSRDAKGGLARCVITVDEMLTPEALKKLRGLDNIVNAIQIDLHGRTA